MSTPSSQLFLTLLGHADTKKSKDQIPNSQCDVHCTCPGTSALRLDKTKVFQILQTASLNNLTVSIVLSCIAAGFSVLFTLLEPVPLTVWRGFYVFGLLSFGQGLSTVILTSTAASCAKTTPELYYMSLVLTVASVMGTGFFVVKCSLWLINRLDEDNAQEVASSAPP
ncbi:hypothetical protein WMY93_011747 [Mugilogobius chulae]|uniref:Uncharacterized protein n=1 Tax=Mugilogobius chulae TaxID=88201 RepID=A0AAW0P6N9_9GOBI